MAEETLDDVMDAVGDVGDDLFDMVKSMKDNGLAISIRPQAMVTMIGSVMIANAVTYGAIWGGKKLYDRLHNKAEEINEAAPLREVKKSS